MTVHQHIPFINNGMATPYRGYRQIVFTPDMVVRGVYSIRTKGDTEQHTTLQRAFEGDILVRVDWHPYTIKTSRLVGGRWKEFVDESLWDDLPETLKDFLSPVNRKSYSYLPEGYGWDGVVTESALRKIATISKFLKNIQVSALEKINELAVYSTMHGLPLKWERAFKARKSFNQYKEPELVNGLIVWFKDGRVEWWDVKPTDKFFFPHGVMQYVKVYLNCYTNASGISYGIKWDLFK